MKQPTPTVIQRYDVNLFLMAAPVFSDQRWVVLRSWTSYVTALTLSLGDLIIFLITWIYWPLFETWITLHKKDNLGPCHFFFFFFDPRTAPPPSSLQPWFVTNHVCRVLPVEGYTCLVQVFKAFLLLPSHHSSLSVTSLIPCSLFSFKWGTPN